MDVMIIIYGALIVGALVTLAVMKIVEVCIGKDRAYKFFYYDYPEDQEADERESNWEL